MSKVTKATFTDRLETAVRKDSSLAADIQDLIVYAREFYKNNSASCAMMDRIVNAPFKASRIQAIIVYFVAHSNVKCTTDKETGARKFQKDAKSLVKQLCAPLPLNADGSTKTWHEFSKEPVVTIPDYAARVKSLIKGLENDLQEGKKMKQTKGEAKALLANLKTVAA